MKQPYYILISLTNTRILYQKAIFYPLGATFAVLSVFFFSCLRHHQTVMWALQCPQRQAGERFMRESSEENGALHTQMQKAWKWRSRDTGCQYLGWIKVGGQGCVESFRASGGGDTGNISAETRHKHVWSSIFRCFRFPLVLSFACVNRKINTEWMSWVTSLHYRGWLIKQPCSRGQRLQWTISYYDNRISDRKTGYIVEQRRFSRTMMSLLRAQRLPV